MRITDHLGLVTPCHRLTLRHGGLYHLQLKQSPIAFELLAFNFHPDHTEWQFLEGDTTIPPDVNGAHLLWHGDGPLVACDDFTLDDTGRLAAFEREDLLASDLEAADDRAGQLWAATFGDPDVCPRCGALRERTHHALCHDPKGVPLFPHFSKEEWLGSVNGQCTTWEQQIALDAIQR